MGQRQAPAQAAGITARGHDFTGEIRRADAAGSEISGFLIDKLGFRIALRGTKDPRKGHGYLLVGLVDHIPAHLRQPAIDDPQS